MAVFQHITQSVRVLLIALLSVPVFAGLVGVVLPAFGYFPALNAFDFNLGVFKHLFALSLIHI